MKTELALSLIADFEKVLAADTNKTMEDRHAAGEYHFIPLALDRFVDQFQRATMAALVSGGQEKPIKFIDVGCGVGTKVATARHMGWYNHPVDAFGIEKDARYVSAARSLLSSQYGEEGAKAHIIIGDALRHNYGEYNIIYFYRPLSNAEKQKKLEERILSTSKKGAVVIANGAQTPEFGGWRNGEKGNGSTRELYDRTIFLRV